MGKEGLKVVPPKGTTEGPLVVSTIVIGIEVDASIG